MSDPRARSMGKKQRKRGGTWAFVLAIAAGSAAFAVIGSPSCTHNRTPRTPIAPRSDRPEQEPLLTGIEDSFSSRKENRSYADAIRRRQFERAARLIDAATEQERRSPEVRYARAIAAVELGDFEKALRLVDKLGEQFPMFAEEAKRIQLEAAKRSHDVTLLEHFLGGSQDPEDLLLVAEAHEKSSSDLEARKLAENALAKLTREKGSKVLELRARAHQIKARTLLAANKKTEAAEEFHWLATEGAKYDKEGLFEKQISSLDPGRMLSASERQKRLESFSEAGLVEQCELEIESLKKLSVTNSPEELDALLAWAFYNSRTDYEKAAELFARAASHGGKNRKEYLYYEAKSLARSHRDHEAIGKYETVAALGGPYADHAAYQAARLRFIDGQWEKAVQAYERYLKTHGNSAKHREGALADLPIARLAAEDYAAAFSELKKAFEKESSERERARLLELMGVARLGQKKTVEAAELFRRVIEYRPLSYPALLAAARLREMGEPVPPLILPPPSSNQNHQGPLSISLPEKVWRLSRVGLDEEAEHALRSHEPELRRKYKERSGEALCRAYGLLESAMRRYQVAQTAASWSVLKFAPSPDDEWQWDCIYPTPYEEVVRAEAQKRDVPPAFIYGVMRQESAFRPTVVSPANAVGLMQIIPSTARRIALGLNTPYEPDAMRSPAVNIGFGAYYLEFLMDIFQDRLELVAASYNAGPHAVSRWLRAGESLPLDVFVARIPYEETRNYVYLVMGNYARYAYRDAKTEVPAVDLKIPSGLKAPDEAY